MQGGSSSSSNSGSISSADIVITQLRWGPVQVYNTTLTCGAPATAVDAAPPVTLVAETAAQLLTGIQLLGRLQPSTITLARDMSVPAGSWPKGLMVNRSMVLAGLPPPGPRTLLDLYQVCVLKGRGQGGEQGRAGGWRQGAGGAAGQGRGGSLKERS